jgi:hypothetical protein
MNQEKSTGLRLPYLIKDVSYRPQPMIRDSYTPLPMTVELFWKRVSWLRRAMLEAGDFKFRLIFFHKLEELMKRVP